MVNELPIPDAPQPNPEGERPAARSGFVRNLLSRSALALSTVMLMPGGAPAAQPAPIKEVRDISGETDPKQRLIVEDWEDLARQRGKLSAETIEGLINELDARRAHAPRDIDFRKDGERIGMIVTRAQDARRVLLRRAEERLALLNQGRDADPKTKEKIAAIVRDMAERNSFDAYMELKLVDYLDTAQANKDFRTKHGLTTAQPLQAQLDTDLGELKTLMEGRLHYSQLAFSAAKDADPKVLTERLTSLEKLSAASAKFGKPQPANPDVNERLAKQLNAFLAVAKPAVAEMAKLNPVKVRTGGTPENAEYVRLYRQLFGKESTAFQQVLDEKTREIFTRTTKVARPKRALGNPLPFGNDDFEASLPVALLIDSQGELIKTTQAEERRLQDAQKGLGGKEQLMDQLGVQEKKRAAGVDDFMRITDRRRQLSDMAYASLVRSGHIGFQLTGQPKIGDQPLRWGGAQIDQYERSDDKFRATLVTARRAEVESLRKYFKDWKDSVGKARILDPAVLHNHVTGVSLLGSNLNQRMVAEYQAALDMTSQSAFFGFNFGSWEWMDKNTLSGQIGRLFGGIDKNGDGPIRRAAMQRVMSDVYPGMKIMFEKQGGLPAGFEDKTGDEQVEILKEKIGLHLHETVKQLMDKWAPEFEAAFADQDKDWQVLETILKGNELPAEKREIKTPEQLAEAISSRPAWWPEQQENDVLLYLSLSSAGDILRPADLAGVAAKRPAWWPEGGARPADDKIRTELKAASKDKARHGEIIFAYTALRDSVRSQRPANELILKNLKTSSAANTPEGDGEVRWVQEHLLLEPVVYDTQFGYARGSYVQGLGENLKVHNVMALVEFGKAKDSIWERLVPLALTVGEYNLYWLLPYLVYRKFLSKTARQRREIAKLKKQAASRDLEIAKLKKQVTEVGDADGQKAKRIGELETEMGDLKAQQLKLETELKAVVEKLKADADAGVVDLKAASTDVVIDEGRVEEDTRGRTAETEIDPARIDLGKMDARAIADLAVKLDIKVDGRSETDVKADVDAALKAGTHPKIKRK
ncbi:MAG: hypothetical protein KBC95_01015 [Candidatus Peribacteraceae bacterium]|nr:hypothetical protein [Candidatus Peribacteraceae bacterium]